MISILPDGIPVDKMQGGDDDDPRCPVATQDYVCDSWSEGGPMTGNAQETYKDMM
tara:strand:- start:1471 stop:1635 length:165 start_codon:yes stop_codon:yes gene_type:complete